MNQNNIYKNSLVAKNENGDTVNIGTVQNICLCCGEIIPEGREICINCESTLGG